MIAVMPRLTGVDRICPGPAMGAGLAKYAVSNLFDER